MALSAASLSVEVDADVSAAQSAMSDIDARIQALAGDHAPIAITADASAALGDFDAVQAEVDALAAVAPNILVDADTSAAVDGLAEVSDAASAVADTAVTATVDADTDAALSALDDVQSTAEAIDGQTVSVAVEADTAEAQSSLDGLSKAFGDVIKVGAGFTLGKGLTAAPGVFLDMAHAAADDAASVTRLQTSVNNAEGGWAKYGTQIDAAIKRGQELAFSDDDVRAALSKLTTQTGSAGEALNRLSVAEDFARGAGIDLGTAAKLLGKVTDESSAALSRYGIVLEKGASAQQALNEVDARFGGQAGAFAASDAGKFAIMSDKVQELQESLGAALLPALSAAAAAVGVFASAMQAASSTGIGSETIKLAAAAIGGVLVVALGAAAVAAGSAAIAFIGLTAAALPWIALAAGVAVGLVLINDKWHLFTDGADKASDALYTAADANNQYVISADGTAYAVDRAGLAYDRAARMASDYMGVQVTAQDVINGYINGTDGITYSLDRFLVAAAKGVPIYKELTSGQIMGRQAAIEYVETQHSVAAVNSQVAEGVGLMGAQFGAMTQWIDNAAHSMDGYKTGAESAWSAQQALNGMLSDASTQVSYWEGNLKTAEGALDILNKQVESGIPLTDKQTAEQDLLTTAVGRYQGGVEDAQGAVVDAAAAQAEFILIQDDLNGKLAAGTITQGEYNQQMSAATAVIDPAASSSYGLAAAQDTVAVAIDGVVNKLGNMLIDLGLLPESKRTEFQTPGLVEAGDNVHILGEGIGALPTEFTITAYVNTNPAMVAIHNLAGYIPESPAEKGPFSKVPDWSFLTWTLGPTMDGAVQIITDGGVGMMSALDNVTMAALTTTDAANLLGSALLDAGYDASQTTMNLFDTDLAAQLLGSALQGTSTFAELLGSALLDTSMQATGAAGSIGEVGAAAVTTSTYLAEMGGYLSDTAMLMGNVASGATSMYDALNSGLVGGAYQGGGPLGNKSGAGGGGSFLTGGQYTPFGASDKAGVDALASAVGAAVAPLAGVSDAANTTLDKYYEYVAKTGDTLNDFITEVPKAMHDVALQNGKLLAAGQVTLESLLSKVTSPASGGGGSTAGAGGNPYAGPGGMQKKLDELNRALADYADGVANSAATMTTLDMNLNGVIEGHETAFAKQMIAKYGALLAPASSNDAYAGSRTATGAYAGAMGGASCPPSAVHLFLTPDQSTPIATWIGDEQASLALTNAGLRGF